MHEKIKSHIDEAEHEKTTQEDISDALYHAITSRELPYNQATANRITRINCETGNVFRQYILDYGLPTQELLVKVEYLTDGDDEVSIDRFQVSYVKGKGKVPFIATA